MDLQVDFGTFRILAEALGLGLLVGTERTKDRDPGERRFAGLRTFALLSLLGAVSGLPASPMFAWLTFSAVAVLVALSYYRSAEASPGQTTEIAALLVFWLGFLLHTHEELALSLGILTTLILAAKGGLHRFVREEISETELFDTVKFLALILVVLPILPYRRLGPWEVVNPRQVWLLIILVSAVSYAGYFLVKWVGGGRGLRIAAVAGGLVSATAATASLAARAREAPDAVATYTAALVAANAVQFPRLLFLAWIVDAEFGRTLAVPLLTMSALALAIAWWLGRSSDDSGTEGGVLALTNPLSLGPTLKFAALFVGVLYVVEAAERWLGDGGVALASTLGGLGSAGAVTLSLAEQTSRGGVGSELATWSVFLAITANAVVKSGLVLSAGARSVAIRLAVVLALVIGTGAAVTLLAHRLGG